MLHAVPSPEHIRAWSLNNRRALVLGGPCGCFHCCGIFPAHFINEWTDRSQTALCPCCGIDSVVPLGSLYHAASGSIEDLLGNKDLWYEKTSALFASQMEDFRHALRSAHDQAFSRDLPDPSLTS